jgi:hypothetical protein
VNRRPGGSEGPEDVDAAFAEIVAGLEREGLGTSLIDDADSEEPPDRPASSPATERDRPGWRPSAVDWDPMGTDPMGMDALGEPELAEHEHFVPPEPPPLPKLRAGTVFGILLIALGIMLLVAPNVVGLEPRIGIPLALVSLVGGIGWLVLRMRQGPPPDSGWDDGARL